MRQLSGSCQQILFDFDLRMAESVDYNPSAKYFCAAEIREFCPRNDTWGFDTMHCLRGAQANGKFSTGCLAVRAFARIVCRKPAGNV